jgi:hypothetical protein
LVSPDRLRGEEIPLGARIVSVWDAHARRRWMRATSYFALLDDMETVGERHERQDLPLAVRQRRVVEPCPRHSGSPAEPIDRSDDRVDRSHASDGGESLLSLTRGHDEDSTPSGIPAYWASARPAGLSDDRPVDEAAEAGAMLLTSQAIRLLSDRANPGAGGRSSTTFSLVSAR